MGVVEVHRDGQTFAVTVHLATARVAVTVDGEGRLEAVSHARR